MLFGDWLDLSTVYEAIYECTLTATKEPNGPMYCRPIWFHLNRQS